MKLIKNKASFHSFIFQLKYDIKQAFSLYIKNILISAVIFLLFCLYISIQLGQYNDILKSAPTVADIILFIFKGMEEYHPELGEKFEIPVTWLAIQMCIAYLIGNFAIRELKGFGQLIIIRTNNINIWFISKCIYSVNSVVLFYSIGYIVIIIYSIVTDSFSLILQSDVNMYLSHIDTNSISIKDFYLCLIVLPILTSIAISIIQTLLMFLVKPVFSFIIISLYTVTSAYYLSYFLIGNYLMLLRSECIVVKGINPYLAIIVDVIIIVGSVVMGCVLINKHDFIERN